MKVLKSGPEIRAGDFKKPLLHANIKQKYKLDFNSLNCGSNSNIYEVIKEMLEEHSSLNKNAGIKSTKFEWREFSSFTAYQVYTLLQMNKDIDRGLQAMLMAGGKQTQFNFK